MKIHLPNEKGWYCGYWTGDNIEIKISEGLPVREEKPHKHSFSEYYLMISGSIILKVGIESVKLNKLELLVVEPGEEHRLIEKSGDYSCIIIKEKSLPNNKQ